MEVIKDWGWPATAPLRLAIFFGLSALKEETYNLLSTDIHSENMPCESFAESPEPLDGLGGREPLRGAHYCQPPRQRVLTHFLFNVL